MKKQTKEFKLNENTSVLVSEGGRMTFYSFEECSLQLLSSQIGKLRGALNLAEKYLAEKSGGKQ